jgi:hypothetical protein
MSDEHVDLATLRIVVESAIHAHALECSKRYRAGKFTRVGQDFHDEVRAGTEAWVRSLRNLFPTLHPAIEPVDEKCYITGALMERVAVELNRAIGRMVQNKVQRHPTVGKTLGRTM